MFPGTEIAHFNRPHRADLRFLLPLTTEAQAASKSWFVIEYKKGNTVLYKSQTLDLCSFAPLAFKLDSRVMYYYVHLYIHAHIHT